MSWGAFGRGLGAAMTTAGEGIRNWAMYKTQVEEQNKEAEYRQKSLDIQKLTQENAAKYQDNMYNLAMADSNARRWEAYYQAKRDNESMYLNYGMHLKEYKHSEDMQAAQITGNKELQEMVQNTNEKLQTRLLTATLLERRASAFDALNMTFKDALFGKKLETAINASTNMKPVERGEFISSVIDEILVERSAEINAIRERAMSETKGFLNSGTAQGEQGAQGAQAPWSIRSPSLGGGVAPNATGLGTPAQGSLGTPNPARRDTISYDPIYNTLDQWQLKRQQKQSDLRYNAFPPPGAH